MARTIEFTKMEGLGNDYVYVDAMRFPIEDPQALAVRMGDRHTGIGSDGLILIGGSSVADFSMRIFNADGSEGLMCGNGARCVGKYVYDKGLTDKKEITLETVSGVRTLSLETGADGKVSLITVDMGSFEARPLGLNIGNHFFDGMSVNVGNPHFVVFTDSINSVAVYGKSIEHHALFPDRTNVEFATSLYPGLIKMKVWERGSGMTMACGTGACATAVAAVLKGIAPESCTVRSDGGDLEIRCDTVSRKVYMKGPANLVFEGTVTLPFDGEDK